MENQEVITISQDLQDKLNAIEALVQTHTLLGLGTFQYRNHQALKSSLHFLESLHKQVMEEALAHPDADKVQSLVEYKAQQEALKSPKGQE